MGERTNNDMGKLSLDINIKNRFSRNLLQRFTGGSGDQKESDPEEYEEQVELNLGLSLGGRFGVDKSKLIRSSSIAAILPVVKDDDVLGVGKEKTGGPGGSYSGLIRTSSLPVETEDEWRKRKELQSLRRLAAKRRRSEKQKRVEREELGRVGSSLGSGKWDFGGATSISVATSDVTGGGVNPTTSFRGSVESQASSVSEFESRHLQGSSTEGEASPASAQSSQERISQDGSSSSRSKVAVEPAIRQSRPRTENPPNNKGKEIRSSTIDMPCVFTQGDGPGGRRIDGILYKYGKGEEVKIMCVCHGSFLTPAEFVRHAGGTDVDHPLKHIVVNPNSSSYL